MAGTILLVAVLAVATVVGLLYRARNGRMRDAGDPGPPGPPSPEHGTAPPGAQVGTGLDAGAAAVTETQPGSSTDLRPEPVSAERRAEEPQPGDDAARLDPSLMRELGVAPDTTVTLLQFSSSFCQPCRATRLVLGDVAATVPGVEHVEVDVERHMDLVRRFDIRRTPTVFVLDGDGRVRKRASGQPRRVDVFAAVAAAGAVLPPQQSTP